MSDTADAGTAAIGAMFSGAVSLGGGIGPGAMAAALDGAGQPARRAPRPVIPFALPPGIMAGTAVGSVLDLPHQFGPRSGWFWDVTALTATGFSSGAIAVSKNAPLVTTAGNPWAIEPVGSFTQAGIITFPQKGMPLLDSSDRLVFTVTTALSGGFAQISGQVIAVPAERIDEYLS